MYLVQSGSLTVVARTAREAMRIRESLVSGKPSEVRVTDMNGFAIDLESLVIDYDDRTEHDSRNGSL